MPLPARKSTRQSKAMRRLCWCHGQHQPQFAAHARVASFSVNQLCTKFLRKHSGLEVFANSLVIDWIAFFCSNATDRRTHIETHAHHRENIMFSFKILQCMKQSKDCDFARQSMVVVTCLPTNLLKNLVDLAPLWLVHPWPSWDLTIVQPRTVPPKRRCHKLHCKFATVFQAA